MNADSRFLQDTACLADRRDCGAVLVRGPDARAFLESLVSNRIMSVQDGAGVRSLLLQPNGKLDVDFRLLVVAEEFWLDSEPGYGARLAASLERFKLRVDVEVVDRSDEWGCLGVRGRPSRTVVRAALGVEPPGEPHAHVGWRSARVVHAPWPDVPGVDVVGPLDDLESAADALVAGGAVAITRDDYENLRILRGVPRQGVELDEKTIAQEAFLDRDAIDFEKGCFLGQELVRRIRDRGRVTRYLRMLRIVGSDAIPPRGAEVLADGASVGSLRSVASSADGAVALGFVRGEIEPGTRVEVRSGAGELEAVVEEIPTA